MSWENHICRFRPAWSKWVLWALGRLRLTGYGPEQVDFLRYRPVLSNRRLVEEFGYTPSKTSLEALRAWAASRG